VQPPATAKQLAALREIEWFIAAHGYAPTLAELAVLLGIAAQTVDQHLRALERKGMIERRAGSPRTIRILGGTAPPTSAPATKRTLTKAPRLRVVKPPVEAAAPPVDGDLGAADFDACNGVG
jgi:repressor LexA